MLLISSSLSKLKVYPSTATFSNTSLLIMLDSVRFKGGMIGRSFIVKNAKKIPNIMRKISLENPAPLPRDRQKIELISLS